PSTYPYLAPYNPAAMRLGGSGMYLGGPGMYLGGPGMYMGNPGLYGGPGMGFGGRRVGRGGSGGCWVFPGRRTHGPEFFWKSVCKDGVVSDVPVNRTRPTEIVGPRYNECAALPVPVTGRRQREVQFMKRFVVAAVVAVALGLG